ncbi:SDR family NAD(P)-dependent oxidoreductase [Kutzneria sp. CA-103260]|uniref:SDR family NAD(P)-dependent oxidoreductase n=1 Tax=Kutzneria sp. CA-103260 TaxID=2802641 RepID=UPI001BF03BF0|nr:SDR family oxidoreductase [Kutzneria sp. CA-103260]QUQ64657.1 3-oxoacyl-[acyl-carrier-protein] reductase [Kutzneria sp. CA-103260]
MGDGMRGVLVTGASRGIGRAVAEAFAARGDRVAVHYGNGASDAEETLRGLTGDGHVLVRGDLSDPEAATRVVTEAVDGLGAVDVLVNNAALAPTADSRHAIAEVAYEDWVSVWRRTFEVNLFGAANVTWAVARHLLARSAPGAVVNVGSRGAFRGEPEHPAYGASKAALHALGQSLAIALAPHNIAVSTVAPGFVATERQAAKLTGDEGDALRSQSPFGRVGTPAEVAAAVVYLASPEAAWSSGTILDVNGASYLRT